jgi:thiol-disulfide isomerase/thioredoxin
MKTRFKLLSLFYMMMVNTFAQQKHYPLILGDPAPPLRIQEWLKGSPIKSFEKGKIYVVEFWATWCQPCMAAMPHLASLSRAYKDTVTVIAMDIYEQKNTSMSKIKAFVDGKGSIMDFHVAAGDSSFTAHDWLYAWGENASIPKTFVVNIKGQVAWIGHPRYLDDALRKIVNNKWDLKEASSKRNFNKYLEDLDHTVAYKMDNYKGDYDKLDDLGKPDSILFVINEMIKKEPKLKYAPITASFTFSALLRTDPHKAYEFGKEVMVMPTYQEPAYDFIIGAIKDDSRKFKLPKEIYHLGAECYQTEIDNAPYPELVDMQKKYRRMADWYRLAGDEAKAIESEQKAIKLSTSNSASDAVNSGKRAKKN